MADEGTAKENEGDKKIIHTYPLVKVKKCDDFEYKNGIESNSLRVSHLFDRCYCHCLLYLRYLFWLSFVLLLFLQYSDMPDEQKGECVELSITACEKFAANYEVSMNMIALVNQFRGINRLLLSLCC